MRLSPTLTSATRSPAASAATTVVPMPLKSGDLEPSL